MKKNFSDYDKMLLLFFCIVIFATSCKDKKKDELTFNAETPLIVYKLQNGSSIDLGESLLGSPFNLMYHPKDLLVCTDNQSQYMLKIIDLKTGKMQELVRKGRGPHECLYISCLSMVGNDIWAFGPQLKKMLQMRSDSLGNFSVVDEIIIADQTFQCVALQNDLFAGPSFTKDRVSYYNGQGEFMYSTTVMPKEINLSESKTFSNVVFQTDITVASDGAKVLLANKSIDIIECYSNKGDSLFSITGPDGFRPELRKKENGGMSTFPLFPYCFAYTNIRAVGEEVWASYIGEMYDGKTQTDFRNILPSQIYCFTFNGVPKRKLELDMQFVSFAVNTERNKLYFLFHNPDVGILEFDISDIKD